MSKGKKCTKCRRGTMKLKEIVSYNSRIPRVVKKYYECSVCRAHHPHFSLDSVRFGEFE